MPARPGERQLRAVLRHRAQAVWLRTLRNQIHAVLADHGHGRPEGRWSGPGRQWLASLELSAVSREVIDDGLALTDALQQPIAGRAIPARRGRPAARLRRYPFRPR